jgi:hypothetical protein
MFGTRCNVIAIYWLVCLSILVGSAPAMHAQTLEHIREFWDFTPDVQFLPGGYVLEAYDGKPRYFIYKDSKFERLQGALPPLLKNWTAFDWSVDYDDQINVISTLPKELRAVLPKRARVKKFLQLDGPDGKSWVALTCYTHKTWGGGINDKDIFLTAALETNPTHPQAKYRKLWTRKLDEQSNYGDFQYQSIPGAGKFVVLYTTGVGGDAVTYSVDVYRLKGM